MEYKNLNLKGANLDKYGLEQYLEKLASDHVLQKNSEKQTYPIPKVKENFAKISEVYHLLDEHIKLGIPIHPAGEWLLDNFYIIEETVKTIINQMPLKKYKNFLGIANGTYKGFARIYVLAFEIVSYTDSRIDAKNISSFLSAYQRKKTLSMEEIWNLNIFMQIALIQGISDICEKIYFSQMQKYRVENIFERLVEKKEDLKYKNLTEYRARVKGYGEMKYPFIEYLSYRLNKQGRIAIPFLNILEEQVNKMGTTIEEVVKKEHYDIAVKKVSMANCITSMKELLRIDFLSIFEEVNGVEEILKQDPANVYTKMDYKTKEYYRNTIKEIAEKTKIAEIYIAKKVLEFASNGNENTKEAHIGYYLIDKGKHKLYKVLQQNGEKIKESNSKAKYYIILIWAASLIIDIVFMCNIQKQLRNVILTIILGITLIFPIQEIVVQVVQYILGKVVKPKLIPKLDFYSGVPKEYSTFVVIPTILKNKEKVEELVKKLEVYYLANKSENLYFALLGDCSSGPNKEEPFDDEVINEGIKQVQILNEKYKEENSIPKFHFVYRKRFWNGEEECYLGWERKRGLLNQFNDYLLGKIESPFLVNTLEKIDIPFIKYIITLDADTNLILNSGLELIGAMAHILNKPVLNNKKDLVIDGHGLIQPRVGINLEAANKNLFTKIFAGSGGTDLYTNAISDVYQDNFDEGIFTGKGIYDLKVFSEVLSNEIPENTVLSHDLLEGSYLRAGLCSDILLMDGYPTNYLSFKARLHRWIRGDFQIARWSGNKIIDKKLREKNNPLNTLSRYKIIDNLIRALTPVFSMLSLIILFTTKLFLNFKVGVFAWLIVIWAMFPLILDIANRIIYKKEGQMHTKSFSPRIYSLFASFIRGVLSLISLPDKAYFSLDAIIRTIYRQKISKKHFLEWTTSEDAEKLAKNNLISYYKSMFANVFFGVVGIIYSIANKKETMYIFLFILSLLWLIAPFAFWYISKKEEKQQAINKVTNKEKEYLNSIGEKTWLFFKESITKENNYLPPDNYQEDRTPYFVDRTSSTNIGLGFLSIISSYDLGYETLESTLELLNNMLGTVNELPKWNGHLYNWYNIKTLEPLIPRYISTVDSGNFVGYVYVLKQFYKDIKEKIVTGQIELDIETKEKLLGFIPDWADQKVEDIPIANADFSKLYDEEKGLFSIGFNIEENKLTDSYYDLLASEARSASFVAISKKDIPSKHWGHLSRTMTAINGYNGLISWSGTAFEYLMPNVIIKQEEGSLLDESIKFMLMSQKEYAKKLGIPWGFSETAYYLKDLNNNYQYKAIGIPWLGLKRGLEEDMVVASYASFMALLIEPKEVIANLKELEKQGIYNQYGFYESMDYTPIRMPKGKKQMPIKTYMAHHQALILLSINNFFNDNILQKRFMENPEIEATSILLQEVMPENRIITKEEKIKPVKITYQDYENYAQRVFTKTKEALPICNIISNDNYSVVMDVKGKGYSKYKNYLINKYNVTEDETEEQGILFYLKNIKNKRIWSINNRNDNIKADKYEIIFTEDSDKIKRTDGAIKSTCKVTIASTNEKTPVEIRNLELQNNGVENETIEITSVLEPALASQTEYNSHPAFQKLFLIYEYLEDENIFIIKRKDRKNTEKGLYLAVSLYTNDNVIGDLEYEIDKEKFVGRNNFEVPTMVKNSKPFSKRIDLVTDPILALRRTICLEPEQIANFSLIICASENREEVIQNIKQYQREEEIKKAFELSIAKADTEARYLRLNAKQIVTYQKILGYLLFENPIQSKEKYSKKYYPKEELWKYGISGDLPILLVKISSSNEKDNLEEILKAYEFFRLKNVEIDLVILNEEPNSYEKYTKETIQNTIMNLNLSYVQNIRGGIYVLENEDFEVVEFYSNLIIDTKKGPVARQLEDLEDEYLENIKQIEEKIKTNFEGFEEEKSKIALPENLLYNNEHGGFSQDRSKYKMIVDKENRLPTVWSHVMANDTFGTLVTEAGGGFTWSKNSGLNKLTAWSNNQVLDTPSEVIYMQDAESLKTWSVTLNPMPDEKQYEVEYGFGYANYRHSSMQIEQNLTTFVPEKDNIKVSLLELKNLSPKKKKLNFVYYIKPVLGENKLQTKDYINLKFKENDNMITLENKTNTDFKEIIYVSCNEKIKSYTADKKFFFGKGNISNPEALKKVSLNNKNSLGKDGIVAIQIEVELESFEKKKISFMLGSEQSLIDCQNKVYKYSKVEKAEEELEKVRRYWEEFLGRVQVETPMESFNILMNGWLIYQTISCRLKARSGFYQSGGAFGFRDQLQDTIALKYFSPEIIKKQIIKHSKHQFIEGDVEHWWHEETSRGIRTKFSDDLLWLVYLVEEYIENTGDYSILEEKTNYIVGEILGESTDERYDRYESSNIEESIFMHCERAIERSLNFGENGLPKIGSGDWNDGFSEVGNKGKGESVWLGFFLYNVLQRWILICEEKKQELENEDNVVTGSIDIQNEELEKQNAQDEKSVSETIELENKIQKYQKIVENLKKALNNNAWDGRWFRRAYTDNGDVLGTIQNEECKIDGISQSWSVISKAGDNDKKYISMESLENHLVDKESGIIKLLDPPFEKSKLEPGYIKAYLPGTRENGGQYTHAAIWAIIAEAMLDFGDKAVELFRMINPIEHARTKETASKYKVEPYVVAADIYGQKNLAGRGGWTWYTGSSSWMYEAGLHYILGLTINKGYLSINPCISADWKEYKIRYKYGNSIYNIKVENYNRKNTGVETMIVNGYVIEDKKVKLSEDGGIYNIEIIM